MKTRLKIFLIISFLILLIISGVFVLKIHLAKNGLPDYSLDVELEGLKEPVKVCRDSLGIPHIFAKSEHDLYMVTGYLMAQDRMWQMDLLRRVTLGRLSEIFGDSFIKTDLLLRSLQYSRKSEHLLKTSSKETLLALEAFAEGVNRYIDKYNGNFPLEFKILGYKPEKWEPLHSLNLIGYMAWDLKSGWSEFVLEKIRERVDSAHYAELLPDPANMKTIVFDEDQRKLLTSNLLMKLDQMHDWGIEVFSGSNNWAVSGKKSVSGKPILANDMHLAFNIPGTWMQIHQVVEGKLNVSGLALPGQPLVVVGHNDSIAWGNTNTYTDNLDYYEEKVNPADSNQYLFNGRWMNFEIHREIIASKGGKKYVLIYRTNHRGPVVSDAKDVKDKVLTIHWAGDEESNELYSIYMVNRAHNWLEFKSAFRSFRSISQNIVYADVQGNIGMYCCAGVPVRKRNKSSLVLPGWTDDYDWKGMVPFDELPNIYNPSCGFVSSANNRTTDNSYPYYIGTWYSQPYRIDRIREMLMTKDKLSVKDFELIQNDQHSKFAELFLRKLLPYLASGSDLSSIEQSALKILENWNYEMSPNEAAPTILELWAYKIIVNFFQDEMGEDLFDKFLEVSNLPRQALYNLLYNPETVWADNIKSKTKGSYGEIIAKSFKETINDLQQQCGSDTNLWHWENFHHLTLTHPLAKSKVAKSKLLNWAFNLNRGPFKVGGSYHTVSPYSYPFYDPDNVIHGASHRSIYDLGNWDNSRSVIPTGTSGVISSRFYCDQTLLYIAGKYHEDYFTTRMINKSTLYTNIFFP